MKLFCKRFIRVLLVLFGVFVVAFLVTASFFVPPSRISIPVPQFGNETEVKVVLGPQELGLQALARRSFQIPTEINWFKVCFKNSAQYSGNLTCPQAEKGTPVLLLRFATEDAEIIEKNNVSLKKAGNHEILPYADYMYKIDSGEEGCFYRYFDSEKKFTYNAAMAFGGKLCEIKPGEGQLLDLSYSAYMIPSLVEFFGKLIIVFTVLLFILSSILTVVDFVGKKAED